VKVDVICTTNSCDLGETRWLLTMRYNANPKVASKKHMSLVYANFPCTILASIPGRWEPLRSSQTEGSIKEWNLVCFLIWIRISNVGIPYSLLYWFVRCRPIPPCFDKVYLFLQFLPRWKCLGASRWNVKLVQHYNYLIDFFFIFPFNTQYIFLFTFSFISL